MEKFIAILYKFYKEHKFAIFLIGLLLFLFFIICGLLEELLFFFDEHSKGITALSAFLVAISGISGIDIWKKKMKGKIDYDIARQYLKAILALRDTLKIVRNPFISTNEMKNAFDNHGFNSEDIENNKKVNRAVYSRRWNKVQEAWTNLEVVLLEAEVLWGKEAINIQEGLDGLVRKLRNVIWQFVNFPEDFYKNKEWEENEKLLYGSYGKKDEFYSDIEREIKKIKKFLEQYL